MIKEALLQDTNNKLEELEAVSEAIKNKEQDIVSIAQQGKEELAELSAEWQEHQNELDNAQDMQTAREIQASKERIEQDIKLQKAVTENAIKKAVSDIEDLVGAFQNAFYSLKKSFSSLDKEVTATLSLRTLEEDESVMSSISHKASDLLGDMHRTLIAQGIVTQGESSYKGLHLSQAPLNAYSDYRKVTDKLKSVAVKVQ